ncbi:hypothetical protein JTE90_026386 [Oedothorax gibbosus]|uniref:Uncharacterized protein n=1 Tax=Oedothorax gibbosus TaxID=931172 RepID=A0AAV6VGE3_9ARAC|nr:hypothetical protein JTE90_026386 [Oedothorax gibbosus]
MMGGGGGRAGWRRWLRKYVVACLVCGGLSVCHGVVFIVLYLLLRSYTTSLQFFETIPTYVPGVVFIITGLILMCFAKRRNRYTFLLKMGGGCCVVCALLCVVMTVTTTVVHMNRLQTLHECVYTPVSRTCMCVSAATATEHAAEGAHRYVFQQTPNCEVVHGSLYSCLRALFSFSVLGVLLCIACSMLTYQLGTHERKRLYWEQLEVRRRFLYQRHSHHGVCGCYDELYPWPLWEMLDYRFLASPSPNNGSGNLYEPCNISSANIHEEEEASTTPANNINRTTTRRNGRRSSGWNWLPWSRHRTGRNRRSNRHAENEGEQQVTTRQNFMNRLMSRDHQQGSTAVPEETCDSVGSLPWRSECIHIFRPSPRDRHCFPPPMRFGMRSRSSPYGRPHHPSHRRTRSNDGIFHHLHMNNAPRYAQPYPLDPACHFTGCEIPRYLWGPPPPYSQPPSLENLAALYGETQSRRTGMSGLEGGLELSRCNQVLSALEMDTTGNGSMSSKMSTPLSERRFVCHNFSSDGITLTIGGGGDYDDLCSRNDVVPQEKEDTCIVEVHVPYILHHSSKKDVVFNTLPARRRRDGHAGNPFKSLSNIPLGLSRRIGGALKTADPGQLSVIKACCDLDEMTAPRDSVAVTPPATVGGLASLLFDDRPPSLGNVSVDTDGLSSYQTMVEAPSDFKSSLLVISTSPSTPVTNNPRFPAKFHAQSLPNLTLSTSSSLRRAPSSGNTSTSQDFADLDLDDDSSAFVLCSPVSDGLPYDSDSSASYPQCPGVRGGEQPFSRDSQSPSDSSSCGVIVIGTSADKTRNSPFQKRDHPTPETGISNVIVLGGKRGPPFTDCPVNCAIRHLHRYRPDKIEVLREVPKEHAYDMAQHHDNRANFVVTIKSVNV